MSLPLSLIYRISYSIMAKSDFIKANRDWPAAKAQEAGVMPLPKGIYYKVLTRGNQSSPTPNRGSASHGGWDCRKFFHTQLSGNEWINASACF